MRALPEPARVNRSSVRIDAENISQRILALPLPARNYGQLVAGKAGTIFLMEEPSRPARTSKVSCGVLISRRANRKG